MEQKKTITLDLTDCKYLGEIHERIKIAFDFPEWYGANIFKIAGPVIAYGVLATVIYGCLCYVLKLY